MVAKFPLREKETQKKLAQALFKSQFSTRLFGSLKLEHYSMHRAVRYDHSFPRGIIQPKLVVGPPNDKYEQEADRVSKQVIRMLEPCPLCHFESEGEDVYQAKPIANQITLMQQEEIEEAAQTKRAYGQFSQEYPRLESGIHSLRSSGQPLPKSAHNFFKPRFGYDFGQVQVHTNAKAEKLAKAVNAPASTIWRDLVFRAGQYTPEINPDSQKNVLQRTPMDELEELYQRFNIGEEGQENGTQIQNLDEKERERIIKKIREELRRLEELEEMRRRIESWPLRPQLSPLEEQEGVRLKETEKALITNSSDSTHLTSRIEELRGKGQTMSDTLRAFFEPRFGYDFSHVRLQTDAQAAQLAEALNAKAFTIGNDIIFGAGQYTPETEDGRILLAHELTHVIQQVPGSRFLRSVTCGGIIGCNHFIQRRILIGSDEMDEDERNAFIQSVRERTLMARNRAYRETLLSHPRLTESILQEMSSASMDYSFPNQSELIAFLAEDIGETPSAEESRQLAGIIELARLPFRAHIRWHSLNAGQRGAVLWEMGRRYGSDFVRQFRQYAEVGHFEDVAEYTNICRYVTEEGLQVPYTPYRGGYDAIRMGYQFAGTGYEVGLLYDHQLWVHPTGRRIIFSGPTHPSGEELSQHDEGGPVIEEEPFDEVEIINEMEMDELIVIWRDIWDALHEGRTVSLASETGVCAVIQAYTRQDIRYLLLNTGQRIDLDYLRDNFIRVTY